MNGVVIPNADEEVAPLSETQTMTGLTTPATADEYGFTVEAELDLLDWCNRTTRDPHDECVHIVADSESRRVHLYRAVGDVDNLRRVKTTLEDVSIRCVDTDAECWCLHSAEANTVVSFLNLMAKERSEPRFSLRYYADNGKGLTDDSPLTEEALYLQYQTNSGRERRSLVQSAYRHPSQMMKKHDF